MMDFLGVLGLFLLPFAGMALFYGICYWATKGR